MSDKPKGDLAAIFERQAAEGKRMLHSEVQYLTPVEHALRQHMVENLRHMEQHKIRLAYDTAWDWLRADMRHGKD